MYLTTAFTDPNRARLPRFLTGIVRGWMTFAARRRKIRYVRISDFPLHLQRDIGILDGHATPHDCDGSSIDEIEAPTPIK